MNNATPSMTKYLKDWCTTTSDKNVPGQSEYVIAWRAFSCMYRYRTHAKTYICIYYFTYIYMQRFVMAHTLLQFYLALNEVNCWCAAEAEAEAITFSLRARLFYALFSVALIATFWFIFMSASHRISIPLLDAIGNNVVFSYWLRREYL